LCHYERLNMNYTDYVTEYLGAGLLFTFSLALAAFELAGRISPDYATFSISGSHAVFAIATLPGTILLLFCILVSYPLGYLLFIFGLRYMRLFGRKNIYEKETSIFKLRPYCDIISRLERESLFGYALVESFERPFSLIRLYLLTNNREIFTILNSYWTRLSRMFCALSFSFLSSSFIFLAIFVVTKFDKSNSVIGSNSAAIALLLFFMSILSALAYRRALKNEIRNFVGVILSVWGGATINQQSAFIFAYGSNMLTARLCRRTPSAHKLFVGTIRGYTLAFNKLGRDGSAKANIVKSEDNSAQVHGVVFQVSPEELILLDNEEQNYDRIKVLVKAEVGADLLADAYIAKPGALCENIKAFDWYLALVIAGAKEHDLPKDYVLHLESSASKADPDFERQRINQTLLDG
jgi:gamma-glutamylcyclotransferase